jgi:4-amino-4-deoxy-L-arabinose transferase-like glycosyltransferase
MLAAILCLVAFVGALQVSDRVFDRVPHVEDEVAFVFQANVFATGQLLADEPPMPDFFYAPFVVRHEGNWFGKYTPGFPLVLSLGSLIDTTWLVNPLLAAACVGLVYVIGRRLYGVSTGLVAAVFLVISPFFLLQAGSLMSHLASLLWTLLFLLMFEIAHRRRLLLPAIGAGVALGMLFLTRPLTAVGIAIPFLIWCGVHILRDPRRFMVYLPIALAFAPFGAMLLAWNQITTGSPTKSAYVLWWPYDRVGFGEGIGVDGKHTLGDGWRFLKINFGWLMRYVFGWPWRSSLVPAALAGIVALGHLLYAVLNRAAQGRRRESGKARDSDDPPLFAWDLLLAGMLGGVVLVHLAYSTPGFMYGPRYYFEALGAVTLLTARGLLHVTAALAFALRRLVPRARLARPAAVIVVAVVVGVLTVHSYTNFAAEEFRKFTGWNNVSGEGVRYVRAQDLSNALVFVQREAWTGYAPFFVENDPRLNGDVVYAIDLGMQRNRDLMALYPEREYYRFADGELEPIE